MNMNKTINCSFKIVMNIYDYDEYDEEYCNGQPDFK